MNLSTKLDDIKGVGEKTAEQFHAANLYTIGDIISFLPRKHEDFSDVVTIADITPGKRTIKARCESVSTKMVRRGINVTTAILGDETGKLQAVWFNQAYRTAQFKNSGQEYYFSGTFEFSYNRYQLSNPSAEKASNIPAQKDRLLPVYPAIKGLKSQIVRKALLELRPFITMHPETLPIELLKQQKLVSMSDALLGMHFPKDTDQIAKARERLAFEELFQLLLAAAMNKQENNTLESWKIPFDKTAIDAFIKKLPFELTPGQKIAAWDIIKDFEKAIPMNRLLQGDVGTGKTVVAAAAILQAARAGFQSVILAPTQILATQHAKTIADMLEPHQISVALLTGSVKGKKRSPLLDAVKNGQVDVVIGTHALLEPGVEFNNLGFVVIDEQHRFGVAQRQSLLNKAQKMPHLLAMTATPIPRSLALTVYGELDISIIATKPKQRKPIISKIVAPTSRASVYEAIDKEIAAGRQAYVICRLIDGNPQNEAKSVEIEYRKLRNSIFGHRKMGLLHGRMKPVEKDQIMEDFSSGKIDILVATTVVEVGVDVPNATAMMIEDADQYGLSQLHQLRGRVGRSSHQSFCFLLTSDNKKPSSRLKEIESSQDGFYLAEVDLKLRGPGEIYGRAQHGALNLQIATLGDTKLIARAQSAAKFFIDNSFDLLHYEQLNNRVSKYRRLTTLN